MSGIRLRPPYVHRALDATSQWLNVVLLDGNPNDSISGRAHKDGWTTAERIIDALCCWESRHCYWAYMNDLARAREILNLKL